MRVRKVFAGAFVGVCLLAALAGFSSQKFSVPNYAQSDKVLHALTFFLITITFYWILEANRRRVVQLTFTVCTIGLSFLSEIVQGLLPNGRVLDYYDIVANIVGSLAALGLCNWYHKRMIDRKRAARGYQPMVGDSVGSVDIELGDGVGGQEAGVLRPSATAVVEEELDHWDENAEDWEDTDAPPETTAAPMPALADGAAGAGIADAKKRSD